MGDASGNGKLVSVEGRLLHVETESVLLRRDLTITDSKYDALLELEREAKEKMYDRIQEIDLKLHAIHTGMEAVKEMLTTLGQKRKKGDVK